ncbi:MAG: cell division protein ZapA [Rhodoferax sp.]|nr:cell division protein ZapA [Rhodoferax sp.]
MKQLEVQIMGQSYLLGCPAGGEARLLEAVERVDTAMCRIRDAGKVRARDRIAVLAALNLAFDLPNPAAAAARLDQPPQDRPTQPAVQGGARSPEGASDPDLLLASLLERLDAALREDGRLL